MPGRGAEWGRRVREWLCSLVIVEVLELRNLVILPGRRPAFWCRKRGYLGHYKKRIFRPLKKGGFFALFEKRLKTLVLINKYGHFIKIAFFVFVPKQVENRVKINIVSNLP